MINFPSLTSPGQNQDVVFSVLLLAILGDFFLKADVIVKFADFTFSSSHPECVSFFFFFF